MKSTAITEETKFAGPASPDPAALGVSPASARDRAEMGRQAEYRCKTSPFPIDAEQPVSVRIKLLETPVWFKTVAEEYYQARLLAQKAVQNRNKENKTAIASVARYAIRKSQLPSHCKDSLCREVEAEWRAYKANWRQGKNRKHPFARTRLRFLVRNRGVSIDEVNQKMFLHLRKRSGLSAEIRYEAGDWQQGRFRAAVCTGETEFIFHKDSWFASVAVKLPCPMTPGPCLAVLHAGQFHMIRALCIAPNWQFTEFIEKGSLYWHMRRKWKRLRSHLQRKRLRSVVKRLGHREKRWSNDYFHSLAVRIVGWLEDQGVGLLAIGSHLHLRDCATKKSKDSNWHLSMWGFRRMLDRIEYKARLAGIQVFIVDERKLKVSLECWRCGEPQDIERRHAICRCGNRCEVGWNALRQILAATGITEKIFRKPHQDFERKEVCEEFSEGFQPKLFGISDMQKRLQHWSLRNGK